METLADVEMLELQSMLACAARRMEALQAIALKQPDEVFRSDARLALSDAIAPLRNALESLE